MTGPEVTDALELEVWIDARPETIFAFFTDPEKLVRWQGTAAELDPRPGGIFRVNVTGRDIVRGEFVEVVPYSRIVFTYGWEEDSRAIPPGSTTVEVTLTPESGGTRLRLRHHGLTAETREQHAIGWRHYLDRLVVAAPGGDPGADPWIGSNPMDL